MRLSIAPLCSNAATRFDVIMRRGDFVWFRHSDRRASRVRLARGSNKPVACFSTVILQAEER
jgi:hypothetical protein